MRPERRVRVVVVECAVVERVIDTRGGASERGGRCARRVRVVDRSIDRHGGVLRRHVLRARVRARRWNFERNDSGKAANLPANFAFRNNYLVVYALMMAGDWLQGPYVYALYKHYGYSTETSKPFIAIGASMILGQSWGV